MQCTELITWWNTNWLTVISIIVSGLISLVISAGYYHRGNRNNLEMSFVFPALKVLEEKYSAKGYSRLNELNGVFVIRYLKNKEKMYWKEVLQAYKAIANHTETNEKVDCLCSYFEYKLKSAGIDLKPVPIEYEGEVVYYDYPPDYHYLSQTLDKQIDGYMVDENYFEEIGLESTISQTLYYYAKELYSCESVTFFDDFNLYKVLSKSRVKKEWDEKYKILDKAVDKFKGLKIARKCSENKKD